MQPTYYEILGVAGDASVEEITRKWKLLIREHHPDRNDASDATRKTAEINHAYEILSDSKKRRKYDKKLMKQLESQRQLAANQTESQVTEVPPAPRFLWLRRRVHVQQTPCCHSTSYVVVPC